MLFQGRPINSTWAIPKTKYIEKLGEKAQEKEIPKDEPSSNELQDGSDNQEVDLDNEPKEDPELNGDTAVKGKGKKGVSKRVDRKVQKLQKAKKRARIVVRNLAFQVSQIFFDDFFFERLF